MYDSRGIESEEGEDTLVRWWVMVHEPNMLRSPLESLSWPPSPETQALACCPSLQGALRVAFCCSDESWERYAAGKISLQGWKGTREGSDHCESQTQERVANR